MKNLTGLFASGLAVAATFGVGIPALAQYGAIATSTAGEYGISWDHATRQDAERAAVLACGQNCLPRAWFQNSCGAIAKVGSRTAWGYALTKGKAEGIALGQCGQNNCVIVASRCSNEQ